MTNLGHIGARVALCVLISVGITSAHPEISEQIRAITATMQERPNDPELFLRRGELHRIHRDWTAAERDYARARALDPELAEVVLAQGRMRIDAGRPAEAVEPLERYRTLRPDDADGMVLLAQALAATDKHLRAARLLDRAVDSADGGTAPDVFVARARAYAAAGPEHLERAIAGLDEGLRRLGSPIALDLEALELELRSGVPQRALTRLERITANAPRKEAWLARRGEILESVGRLDEARVAYAAALSAIDELPVSRRATPAIDRLQRETTQALSRLEDVDGVVATR